MHDTADPIDSSKPIPMNEKIRELRAIIPKYRNKKANILVTISAEITFPLSLTGRMALGCTWRLNSLIAFLQRTISRTIFIPPEVEPAQAQKGINKLNAKV